MKQKRKKRALTLLEIMIVIVLIGLIGSVIGVNMKGSMDEGRAFKTRQAQEQIADILMLETARGTSLDEVVAQKEIYLENSGLVKDVKSLLKDGWGQPFDVKVDHDQIVVHSDRLNVYELKKDGKLKKKSKASHG